MYHRMVRLINAGILGILFLAGCKSSTPTLTLTIKENECAINGPTTIPYGKLVIKMVIQEQKPSTTGYMPLTLDQGKTIEDLKAWSSIDTPDWVMAEVADEHQEQTGTSSRIYDLASMPMLYHSEPLYIECIRADPNIGQYAYTKIGALGPIKIKK